MIIIIIIILVVYVYHHSRVGMGKGFHTLNVKLLNNVRTAAANECRKMNSPEDTTAHATESESSKNYLTLHLYHLPALHYVLNVNIISRLFPFSCYICTGHLIPPY